MRITSGLHTYLQRKTEREREHLLPHSRVDIKAPSSAPLPCWSTGVFLSLCGPATSVLALLKLEKSGNKCQNMVNQLRFSLISPFPCIFVFCVSRGACPRNY